MNVLSLFDGISAGQLALQRASIPVEKYFASEVDPYAISITQKNFPKTIHLGDVRDINTQDLPKIDLLMGGSPCTDISISGKRAGIGTDCVATYLELKKNKYPFSGSSFLFWEYVRIKMELQKVNPTLKFLFENVSIPPHLKTLFSEALEGICTPINSSLVSGQHRKRLYWTGIRIPQPADKGVILEDILETGYTDRLKSHCLDASYFKGNSYKGFLDNYYLKSRRQIVLESSKPCKLFHLGKGGRAERVYSTFAKGTTLLANGGGMGAKTGLYLIPTDIPRMQDEGIMVRKLTPLECERLQNFPDEYTLKGIKDEKEVGISNARRYTALGNGWTVDVIKHILLHLLPEFCEQEEL